mmetsp:Transcript_16735/g.45614  ORF Transcript_16735/g.45614 Transcript_16735/m.45614 type:complete len:203 (+) Transcript_16735:148-756(+)
MHERTYSMVWMAWCTISSPKSKTSSCPPPPPPPPSSSARGTCRAARRSWRRLSRSGRGSSSMGTETAAARMRKTCSGAWPGTSCCETGTLPISMNMLIRVSRIEGGGCLKSEQPPMPASQAAALKVWGSASALVTKVLPSTTSCPFHRMTAQPAVAAPGAMHHMAWGSWASRPPAQRGWWGMAMDLTLLERLLQLGEQVQAA